MLLWVHVMMLQCILMLLGPKLPHLYMYYFTTPILILKFTNEGVSFEEFQESHFPRKKVYFGTHLREFGEKMDYFWCPVFYCENGGSFGLKSQRFTTKKGVHFELKSQCFIAKRGYFELKSQCFATKGGNFQTGGQDGYHFLQWVREPGLGPSFIMYYYAQLWYFCFLKKIFKTIH